MVCQRQEPLKYVLQQGDEGTTGAGSDKSASGSHEGATGQTSSVDETVTSGKASGTGSKGKTGRSRANSETGSS